MILQRRLAEKMEPHLQRMQFGFRQNRGTADAIHCIRRIVDKGESTSTPTILLLLDWEKAFDKVSQLGLMVALERMNVDDKMRRVIGALYRNPTFSGGDRRKLLGLV